MTDDDQIATKEDAAALREDLREVLATMKRNMLLWLVCLFAPIYALLILAYMIG